MRMRARFIPFGIEEAVYDFTVPPVAGDRFSFDEKEYTVTRVEEITEDGIMINVYLIPTVSSEPH